MIPRDGFRLRRREVVADRQRNDEISVRQPLHERARSQAIGAMIGEIGFADHVQPGDRAHQVVIDPQASHRVVDSRIDAHRDLVGILVRDALIHLEEIAISLGDAIRA